VQDQHAFLDVPGPIGGDLEHVDGFVERRRGIDVRAEARADRFEERYQLARLEVLRAVEGHVLEKMREAALVRVFLNGARVDGQPHGDTFFRTVVVADEITQPVRQPPGAHRRVNRERAIEAKLGRNRLACCWRRRCRDLREGRGHERQTRET
jgi:hypothetical protein